MSKGDNNMKRTLNHVGYYNGQEIALSVIEHGEEHYEVAVMKAKGHVWEIDYSIFKDVFHVKSPMQVYGLMNYVIKPSYQETEVTEKC
jgi:hypothetical protein